MSTVRRAFKTQAEASAFRDGVEYVNDSAIAVSAVEQVGNVWVVVMEDEDADDTETLLNAEGLDVRAD